MIRTYTATFEVSCPEGDVDTKLSAAAGSLSGTISGFDPKAQYVTAILSAEHGGPVDYPSVPVAEEEAAIRGKLSFSVDSPAFEGRGEMGLGLLDDWIESCLRLSLSRKFLYSRVLNFEGGQE